MSIVPESIKKLAKLAVNKKFREQQKEYKRLSKFPRYKETEAALYGKNIRLYPAYKY